MKWYRNLNIGKKFMFAFTLMIALLVAVGILGIYSSRGVQGNLTQTCTVRMPSLDFLVQTDRDLQQLLVAERSMIFSNAASDTFKQLVADYEENLEQSSQRWNKYKALADTEAEKALIPQYEKARTEWEAVSKQIVEGRKADTREGRRLAIDLSLSTAKVKFETMRDVLDKLQNINNDISKQDYESAGSTYRKTSITILILTALALLVAILIFSLLNKTVTDPIKELVDMSRDLAEGEGDLTKRLRTGNRDELGQLSGYFNQFITRLQETISKVKTTSTELTGSTDKISGGSVTLAERTSEQAASITETSTTLEEFTANVKQNSDNSEDANQTLDAFNTEVQANRELIENMTATMTEIHDSSKKIDDIVNVINDISFQTNLLALNAAVEAARAGEAGRGFAVVAAEVRNLAQKTAESSKTIQDIVTRNVESTDKGTELVKQTSQFFGTIVTVLAEISDKVRGITNASREQSTGVEQINMAITQLEGVINQNAALVDDFAGASKEMIAHSGELKKLMEQFKTDRSEVSKRRAAPSPPPAKAKKEAPTEKAAEKPTKKAKTEPPPDEEDDFFGSADEAFEEF